MIELRNCIPKIEDLARRAESSAKPSPSPAALAEMGGYLQRRCRYGNFNPAVFEAIRHYGAAELEGKNRKGLFLIGSSGIGKTFGVECLAARFGWPVVAAKDLQAAFMDSPSSEEWNRLIEARNFFGEPRCLVIDDIGTEDFPLTRYGTVCDLIADVIDHRYRASFLRHGVKTIITTNLNDDQIRERYGFRIDDRLNEMFIFKAVEGNSLR